MRAQRGDPMSWRRRRSERRVWQIADILVTLELRPGPTFALIIDRDTLPEERLGLKRRVGLRRTPERRACGDDPHPPPAHVAWRIDDAAQMLRREVGAGGGQSAVERSGGHGGRLTLPPIRGDSHPARLCRSPWEGVTSRKREMVRP